MVGAVRRLTSKLQGPKKKNQWVEKGACARFSEWYPIRGSQMTKFQVPSLDLIFCASLAWYP